MDNKEFNDITTELFQAFKQKISAFYEKAIAHISLCNPNNFIVSNQLEKIKLNYRDMYKQHIALIEQTFAAHQLSQNQADEIKMYVNVILDTAHKNGQQTIKQCITARLEELYRERVIKWQPLPTVEQQYDAKLIFPFNENYEKSYIFSG